jgi:uncharacterized protein YjdB
MRAVEGRIPRTEGALRLLLCLVLTGLLALAACTDADQGPPIPEAVQTIVIEPDSMTLVVGESQALAVTLYDKSGRVLGDRSLVWTMSVESVVAVDAAGLVTALAEGVVTLTATVEGRSAAATVVVRPAPTPAPVHSIVLSPTGPFHLRAGDTLRVVASVYDSAGSALGGRVVVWTAGPDSVVAIDEAGLLRAAAGGTGRLGATSEGVTVEVAVTVEPPPAPVASVSLRPALVVAYVGQTMSLAASLRDEDGEVLDDRTVVWATSNATVAEVDASGTVRGLGTGEALITATSEGVSATTVVQFRSGSSYHLAFDRAQPAFLWMNLATGIARPTMTHAEGVRAADPHASPTRSGFAYVIDHGDGEPWVGVQAWNGHSMRYLAPGDQPSFSPSGQLIAFRGRQGGRADIWVVHADGTTAPINLTADLPDGIESESPAWSPTGDRIVFAAGTAARKHLWIMNANGTGLRQITANLFSDTEPAWYGNTIVFTRRNAVGSDLWRVNPGTQDAPRQLTHLGAARMAAWSPDGQWIAFVLRESDDGLGDVMVMRQSGGDIRPLTLRSDGPGGGGLNPTWTIHY